MCRSCTPRSHDHQNPHCSDEETEAEREKRLIQLTQVSGGTGTWTQGIRFQELWLCPPQKSSLSPCLATPTYSSPCYGAVRFCHKAQAITLPTAWPHCPTQIQAMPSKALRKTEAIELRVAPHLLPPCQSSPLHANRYFHHNTLQYRLHMLIQSHKQILTQTADKHKHNHTHTLLLYMKNSQTQTYTQVTHSLTLVHGPLPY